VVQTQYALLRNAACEGDDQRRTSRAMPAVIRFATSADADAIVAVFCGSKRPSMPWLEETYAPAEVRSYVADVLLKTTTVWVALQGGEIVGYAALHDDVLEQLFVAADFQQQGIGGQLLDAARRSAGARMSLYVFTENRAARRFYERHGFISTDDFDTEGELDMRYEWHMPVSA